jgi:hypothetical protein
MNAGMDISKNQWRSIGGIVDIIPDFLIKLGIKPCAYIGNKHFSLNHVNTRPTKIMNRDRGAGISRILMGTSLKPTCQVQEDEYK